MAAAWPTSRASRTAQKSLLLFIAGALIYVVLVGHRHVVERLANGCQVELLVEQAKQQLEADQQHAEHSSRQLGQLGQLGRQLGQHKSEQEAHQQRSNSRLLAEQESATRLLPNQAAASHQQQRSQVRNSSAQRPRVVVSMSSFPGRAE
jgi:hypothetical protein